MSAAQSVVWVPYIPNFMFSLEACLQWMTSGLFPRADELGLAGVKTMQSFRSDLAAFDLPDVFIFAEECCLTDKAPGTMQVIFDGRSVGITNVPAAYESACNGYPNARCVPVRSMQYAHANWWRWLRTLARVHLKNPELSACEVYTRALPFAPVRQTRYDIDPIFPERDDLEGQRRKWRAQGHR